MEGLLPLATVSQKGFAAPGQAPRFFIATQEPLKVDLDDGLHVIRNLSKHGSGFIINKCHFKLYLKCVLDSPEQISSTLEFYQEKDGDDFIYIKSADPNFSFRVEINKL